MANIYDELAVMQALGRETMVLVVGNPSLPSDLTRTEHIRDGRGFAKRFNNFLAGLDNRAEYYLQLADLTEHNPLLVIDFLRRAWTLNDDPSLPIRARQVWSDSAAEVRAKSAVESLMLSF